MPDGETIAFLSVHLKDQPLVYSPMIMDSNGTNARPFGLFSTTDWIDFHWSPDGNQIVYSSGDDQRCGDDLFLINANGSDLRNVTKSPEHDTLPAWSPDGEWLAFISARCNDAGNTGFAQVYIVHVSGMGAMQITTRSNLTITGLTWLPNPALSIGKTYTVTNLGQAVNLRSDPSISGAVHRKLNAMERFSVMEGPVEADDYLWWWVKVGDDEYGWVAELPGWFAP